MGRQHPTPPRPPNGLRRRVRRVLTVCATVGLVAAAVPAGAGAASAATVQTGVTTTNISQPVPAGRTATLSLYFRCAADHPYLADWLSMTVNLSSSQPNRPTDQTRLVGHGDTQSTLASATGFYPGSTTSPGYLRLDVQNPGSTAGTVTTGLDCSDTPNHKPPVAIGMADSVGYHLSLGDRPTFKDPVQQPPHANAQFNIFLQWLAAKDAQPLNNYQMIFCNWSGNGDVPTVYDRFDNTFWIEKEIGASSSPDDWFGRQFTPAPATYAPDFWASQAQYYGMFPYTDGDPAIPNSDRGGCGDFSGLGHDQPYVIRGYAHFNPLSYRDNDYQQFFLSTAGFDPDPTHQAPALTSTIVGPYVTYPFLANRRQQDVPDTFLTGDFQGAGWDSIAYMRLFYDPDRDPFLSATWYRLNRSGPFNQGGSQSWVTTNMPGLQTGYRQVTSFVGDWDGLGRDLPGTMFSSNSIGNDWNLFTDWQLSGSDGFMWGDPSDFPVAWRPPTLPVIVGGASGSRPSYYAHDLWYVGGSISPRAPIDDYRIDNMPAGAVPMMCDWNGDGLRTPGYFDPNTSTWTTLRISPSTGNLVPDSVFTFGLPPGQAGIGRQTAVCGDWDGDGMDTPAVIDTRASRAVWMFRNSNTTGDPDFTSTFGVQTDRFLAGDWNGTGVDAPGVMRFNLNTGQTQWALAASAAAPGNPPLATFGDLCDRTEGCNPVAYRHASGKDAVALVSGNIWELTDPSFASTRSVTVFNVDDRNVEPFTW
jgi:hypothetical protein